MRFGQNGSMMARKIGWKVRWSNFRSFHRIANSFLLRLYLHSDVDDELVDL
jgi:hypothetical protein